MRWFKNTCHDVFESVDIDNTKLVDTKELYAAVLLVYVYISRLIPGIRLPSIRENKIFPSQEARVEFVKLCLRSPKGAIN